MGIQKKIHSKYDEGETPLKKLTYAEIVTRNLKETQTNDKSKI